MLAAAACLVLIATAALVMRRTPETDIYIDGTALSSDPVPIDQPMPMALDSRSTDAQTLCLSLSFESRTDALLEVSVSAGVLDSPSDSSPRALSARTVSAGEILLWTVDLPDESAVYTLYLDGKAAAVLRCDSANGYWGRRAALKQPNNTYNIILEVIPMKKFHHAAGSPRHEPFPLPPAAARTTATPNGGLILSPLTRLPC